MKKEVCSTFRRVEKKYRMNREQYEEFMKRAAGYIELDEYGLHTISNIYYDTEYYDLIRNSIEKPKYKEKFRIRGYGKVTEDSRIFLEIKKKYRGIVYKRRTSLTVKETREYLEKRIFPGNGDQIMREIEYFFQFYKPEPKLYLAYDRMAYAGTEDSSLRLTIDQNIRSRREHLDLTYGDEGQCIDKDGYLMEIKVPAAYPVWLARLLSELEIYPVSFSKYGTVYKESILEEEMLPYLNELQMKNNRKNQKGEKICLQVYSAV